MTVIITVACPLLGGLPKSTAVTESVYCCLFSKFNAPLTEIEPEYSPMENAFSALPPLRKYLTALFVILSLSSACTQRIVVPMWTDSGTWET